MNVDLTPVVQVLLPLALTVVTTAVPILTAYTLRRFKIANDGVLAATLGNACDAAAGAAYNFALQHEGGLSNVAIKNVAIASEAANVVNGFQETMKRFGLTPDHVHTMVEGRLGKLLAADPTVKATGFANDNPTPATGTALAIPAAPAAAAA